MSTAKEVLTIPRNKLHYIKLFTPVRWFESLCFSIIKLIPHQSVYFSFCSFIQCSRHTPLSFRSLSFDFSNLKLDKMLPATKAEYKRARLCLVITQVILCATIVSMTVCLYFKPCPPPKKFFFKPKESGNGYDLYSTGTVSTLVVQTNEEFAFSDEHQETNETGNHR